MYTGTGRVKKAGNMMELCLGDADEEEKVKESIGKDMIRTYVQEESK
jgi:hypothetical protein